MRDVGLLAAAVSRPQTTVGGHDAYPTLGAKAAALLQSVVTNHALVDGNKRLGLVAPAVFLEINGASVATTPNEDVYDLVIDVAAGRVGLDGITKRLESFAARLGVTKLDAGRSLSTRCSGSSSARALEEAA